VAIFEAFVVPRYMALFGEPLLDQLALGGDAQVLHLHCRTGYPDREMLSLLSDAHLYGCDSSVAALELARTKAVLKAGSKAEYRPFDGYPLQYPDGAFSHAITLHPLAAPEERKRLLGELARVLAPRGQLLLAMPTRGSFQDVADLIREYALKEESGEVQDAVEAAVLVRPTVEELTQEVEAAGFNFVEIEVKTRTLKFQSGRDFFEDPITRLMLVPEFRLNLALRDVDAVFAYVRDAADKYFSRSTFDLTVNVTSLSARRAG
jgi:SAM-dependent methyltransferase